MKSIDVTWPRHDFEHNDVKPNGTQTKWHSQDRLGSLSSSECHYAGCQHYTPCYNVKCHYDKCRGTHLANQKSGTQIFVRKSYDLILQQ